MTSIGAIKRRLMPFRPRKIEQLKLDFFVPVFVVPAFLLIASYNVYSTILVLLAVPVLGGHLYLAHLARQSKSKLFFMWSIVSLFLIFVCLEFLIVPLMVVSPWENISFYLLLVGVLCYFRIIRRKAIQSIRSGQQDQSLNECLTHTKATYCSVCSRRVSAKFSHCGICHACVYERSHHNVWINCCISVVNRKEFLILHVLLLCWLNYSSYLIFTAVCKSSLLNNAVLVPEDCSLAYSSFRTSFSFVGAVYSLEMGAFVLASLIREVMRTCWSRRYSF